MLFLAYTKTAERMFCITKFYISRDMLVCELQRGGIKTISVFCLIIYDVCLFSCVFWNFSTTRVTVKPVLRAKRTKNMVKSWECLLEHADLEF